MNDADAAAVVARVREYHGQRLVEAPDDERRLVSGPELDVLLLQHVLLERLRENFRDLVRRHNDVIGELHAEHRKQFEAVRRQCDDWRTMWEESETRCVELDELRVELDELREGRDKWRDEAVRVGRQCREQAAVHNALVQTLHTTIKDMRPEPLPDDLRELAENFARHYGHRPDHDGGRLAVALLQRCQLAKPDSSDVATLEESGD